MSIAFVFAAILALSAWLIPAHFYPWITFHADFAMSCAAFLLTATAIWSRRGAPDRWPALAIVAALAALIPAGQYLLGQIVFLDDAWMSALYLLGFALAQVTGSLVVADHGLRRPIEAFSWLVVVAGLLCVFMCLYQWLRLDYLGALVNDLAPGTRPSANLAQPNQLATLLLWSLVGTGFLFTAHRIGEAVALFLLCSLGLGLAMTQSRAGLVGLALILVWLLATRSKIKDRLTPAAIVVAAVTLVGCVAIWHQLLPLSPEATGRTEQFTDTGVRARHWISMIDAILRRPWAGYGWGQLPAAHYEVALDHPVSGETLAFAHNQALDVLVWSGVPLGALIICAIAWWFVAALRHARTSEQAFATATVLGVFVHAMVEFPLAYAYLLLPTGLLMGGLSFESTRHAFVAVPRGFTAFTLAVAALAVGLVTRDYARLEPAWMALRLEQARIGSPSVEPPPRPLVLVYLGEFLVFARKPTKPGMSEQELDAMKRIVLRYPLASNLLRYAAALAINDQPDQARKNLARICRMSPSIVCAESQSAWAGSGKTQPKIAAVLWPTTTE